MKRQDERGFWFSHHILIKGWTKGYTDSKKIQRAGKAVSSQGEAPGGA